MQDEMNDMSNLFEISMKK